MRTLRKRNLRGGNTNYIIKFFTDLGTTIYNMLGMIVFFIFALFSDNYASKGNGYFGKAWVQGKSVILSELKPKRSYG
jgi:hypothetical protein